MQKVIKWVEKFEKKPTYQTVSNAKQQLDSSRFYKFIELTGYKSGQQSRKGDRRIVIEAMFVGDKIAIESLHSDYSLVTRINKSFMDRLYLIADKESIERVK